MIVMEKKKIKRIYKIENGKKIAGVCGGVAEYFDIDPVIVRVLWAVLSLVWGCWYNFIYSLCICFS